MYKYKKIALKVQKRIKDLKHFSDARLKQQTERLRDQLKNGAKLDSLIVEAYATVCEADRRVLGLSPYYTQILGAVVLNYGNIAEMKTGEGKTLTATMPMYLHGLVGKGAFLITANSYLAKRDAEDIGKVYRWLGLTIASGVPEDDGDDESRDLKKIYSSDIVYTTHSNLGFDYLFDNLATKPENQYIKHLNFALIDEIDSILLDQAQTPLIVSGAPNVQSNLYQLCENMIQQLDEKIDFKKSEDGKKVWFTETGIKNLEEYSGVPDLLAPKAHELYQHLNLALKAKCLFVRNRSYVVENNEIVLLDKMNGRKLYGTKLQSGLHQALEAKEHVKISDDSRALASITYQNLFRLFTRLSGMTGTAKTDADEFRETYHLNTFVIPTNEKIIRKDHADQIYATNEDKIKASLQEVQRMREQHRPVLIETGSVSMSKLYSHILLSLGIPHNILNANSAPKESRIIAEAGKTNSITVATSMAGRGTDIKLSDQAIKNGGLFVVGTERMSSLRIDNQLRGRAGRQGEPGDTKFYVSLEDKIVTENAPKWVKRYREKLVKKHVTSALKKPRIKNIINQAQGIQKNSEISERQNILKFDEVVKAQRNCLYDTRNQVMRSDDLDHYVDTAIHSCIDNYLPKWKNYFDITNFIYNNIDYSFLPNQSTLKDRWRDRKYLRAQLLNMIETKKQRVYKQFENKDQLLEYKRLVLLKSIDTMWIDQVDALEQLKLAVSSRNWGQHNPIYEYQHEARRAFHNMREKIYLLILRNILLSEIVQKDDGTIDLIFV